MEFLTELFEDVFSSEEVVDEVQEEWKPGMPNRVSKGEHDAAIARSGDMVHSLHVQAAPIEHAQHYAD